MSPEGYFGILFLVGGVSQQFHSVIVWSTKLINRIEGVQTKITPTTILVSRIAGIVSILVGLYLVITSFDVI